MSLSPAAFSYTATRNPWMERFCAAP